MSEPVLLEQREAFAIISINDTPNNRMTHEYLHRLEILEGHQKGAEPEWMAVQKRNNGIEKQSIPRHRA